MVGQANTYNRVSFSGGYKVSRANTSYFVPKKKKTEKEIIEEIPKRIIRKPRIKKKVVKEDMIKDVWGWI